MMRFYVEAVGLCGPGLENWAQSVPVLAGRADYSAAPVIIPPCPLLPANERRRAPKMVKLALAVATEAFAAAGRSPAETLMVFSSSGGEGETIHDILNTLASPQREMSPTKFHNSVHNAAAGYWSIATGAVTASTSLCAHDDSFAAGLIEAAVQAISGQAVALVVYDIPYPAPLCRVRPIGAVFGVALVLSPVASAASFVRLDLALRSGACVPSTAPPMLEPLRQTVPAARSLPLLAALAGDVAATVILDYLADMALLLHVTPLPAFGWQNPPP